MSVATEQKQQEREKKGKRGSTNNKSRLDAFSRSDSSSGADWGACDERLLQAVVVAITELGGAVIFGLSRDKGAHSLTLLLDDKSQPLWFNGDADLSKEMQDVLGTLEAMS